MQRDPLPSSPGARTFLAMLRGGTTTVVHPPVSLLRPCPRPLLQARGAAEGLPKDDPAPLLLVADPSACPPPLRRGSKALREQSLRGNGRWVVCKLAASIDRPQTNPVFVASARRIRQESRTPRSAVVWSTS